jgi:hypothetical protein
MDNRKELEYVIERLQGMIARSEKPSDEALSAMFRYAYQLGHFDGHVAGVKFAAHR